MSILFEYRAITFSGAPFQALLLKIDPQCGYALFPHQGGNHSALITPDMHMALAPSHILLKPPKGLSLNTKACRVSAAPLSLAATQGMMPHSWLCFLFLRLLRCFTSPGTLPLLAEQIMRHNSHGVSPFGYLRIKGCLPPPRSFSQATTSFIGSLLPRHPPYTLNLFRSRTHPPTRSVGNPKKQITNDK